MKILALLIFLLLIGLLDLPKLWHKRDWYEMMIVGVLVLIGTTYGFVFAFDIPLPDPNGIIKIIFEPLGKKLIGSIDSL